LKTETPRLTYTGMAGLAFLWTTALLLLWVAWDIENKAVNYDNAFPENGEGVKIWGVLIVLVLFLDTVMISNLLLAIYCLSASLKLARKANQEDEGFRFT
jgi:hypothetical protein